MLKRFLKLILKIVLDRLSTNHLSTFEKEAQLAQGKGVGTSSVDFETSKIIELLDARNRTGCTFFDVGANRGDWTASLLKRMPTAKVCLFEPSKYAFDNLKQRFYGCDQLTLVNKALGKYNGEATLFSDTAGSVMSSLSPRRLDHFGLTFQEKEEVSIMTLDKYCEQYSIYPDVIKLDVEGHELDVLMGAESALKYCTIIQFEFGGCNIDSRTYFQDFFYYFKYAGFVVSRLRNKRLVTIDCYREIDETFSTTNYFALNSKL